jgi:hypothetical protein
MSTASGTQIGNDARKNVLPVKPASGPGFLGPNYNPADEMLPPASIGVSRGDTLNHVTDAVKGVIYYGDMIGFGGPSSRFTEGKPGLRPLGVNYFINSGLTCSNGATMWEYVETIPNGSALGDKVRNALASVGLPQLRGMAPGMVEDVKFALDPAPVINAVVGSGYPQCRLVKRMVGDSNGQIQNVDGQLLVDPMGIIKGRDGRFYQERWIQDREPAVGSKTGETPEQAFARGDPIQLAYEDWEAAPKTYKEDGCLVDETDKDTKQPGFCKKATRSQVITLGDRTTVTAYDEGYGDYTSLQRKGRPNTSKLVSLSVAVISVMCLMAFWAAKRK